MAVIERTVKAQAVELAGAFYEMNKRSDKFRRAFPTVEHFLKGWQVMYKPDGSLLSDKCKKVKPGWLYFVAMARTTLTMMLGQPDARVSPEMKSRIYDAIIEDRNNTAGRKASKVHQRRLLDA